MKDDDARLWRVPCWNSDTEHNSAQLGEKCSIDVRFVYCFRWEEWEMWFIGDELGFRGCMNGDLRGREIEGDSRWDDITDLDHSLPIRYQQRLRAVRLIDVDLLQRLC